MNGSGGDVSHRGGSDSILTTGMQVSPIFTFHATNDQSDFM